MHVDKANQISMTNKTTGATLPIATLGLMSVTADRTVTGSPPFGAIKDINAE